MTANESVHTLADRLLAQPTMPLRTVQFEFGWAVVTADPPDTLWQFWWAKIIGPAPVLALSYLHHISVTHTSVDAPADVLTSTLTGIDTNGSETVSTVTGVDMLAPLLAYRLAFVEHRRGEFDGALGLGLVSPIPRPSRDASDSIASQLAAADGDRP